jgi:hypothetical protein
MVVLFACAPALVKAKATSGSHKVAPRPTPLGSKSMFLRTTAYCQNTRLF